jgi:hypothetical protein
LSPRWCRAYRKKASRAEQFGHGFSDSLKQKNGGDYNRKGRLNVSDGLLFYQLSCFAKMSNATSVGRISL